MNERIQELIKQAENYAAEQNDKFGVSYKKEYNQKFAELIVRECMKVSRKADGLDAEYAAWYLIQQHFGVEEQVQDSKELHTCPYREEIHNDYESLCDCDEEQQHQCAMDI